MTNIGIIYQYLNAETIDTINQIIEDYQAKAKQVMNKPYITAHRDLYPKDSPIGAATQVWNTSVTATATVRVGNVVTEPKIDTSQGVLILGWYCNIDLGNSSRLYIMVNDGIKSEINARTVFLQKGHFLITPKLFVFGKEQDRFNLYIVNALAATYDAIIYPIGILYGEPSILGVA